MTSTPERKLFGYSAWGLSNLFFIYIVWSSTYLAMAIMVDPIDGLPPFWAGGFRLASGGIILLVIALALGKSILVGWKNLRHIAISAIALWVFGNSLVMFALSRNLDTGITAVIIGTTPIWSIVVDTIWSGNRLSKRIIASLVAGTLGIFILNIPNLNGSVDVFSLMAVIVSAISWGSGTVYQSRKCARLHPALLGGWQQLFGAVGYFILSLLFTEHLHPITFAAMFAMSYLIIIASVAAMLAYIIAVNKLPIAVVMSYAYVNPVFALVLGHFFNSETISVYTIVGTLVIVLGVVGIFYNKSHRDG
ncbi:MAG: EamA family transporter [Negativicutes bacterium]|jgi:drug/metabolite transporter (DMT)-like permease